MQRFDGSLPLTRGRVAEADAERRAGQSRIELTTALERLHGLVPHAAAVRRSTVRSHALQLAVGVAEIDPRPRERQRAGLDSLRETNRLLELDERLFGPALSAQAAHRDAPIRFVVADAELVGDEPVRVWTDACGRIEVVGRERPVGQEEVLHADEQDRQVRALKVPLRGRIGGDGLVMLALERVRMRECDPRWTMPSVEEDGLAEEAPRLVPSPSRQVPKSDRVPRHALVRLPIDEIVGQEEERGTEMREVVHRGEVQRHGRAMPVVRTQDERRDEEAVGPSLRCEQVVREAEENVRILAEPELVCEAFAGEIRLLLMLVLASQLDQGETRRTLFSRTVYIIWTNSASCGICCRYARLWMNDHSALVSLGMFNVRGPSSTPSILPVMSASNDSKHLTSTLSASMKHSLARSWSLRCSWIRPRRWHRLASNCMIRRANRPHAHLDAAVRGLHGWPAAQWTLATERVGLAEQLGRLGPLGLADKTLRGQVAARDRDVGQSTHRTRLAGRSVTIRLRTLAGRACRHAGRDLSLGRRAKCRQDRFRTRVLMREKVDLGEPEGVVRIARHLERLARPERGGREQMLRHCIVPPAPHPIHQRLVRLVALVHSLARDLGQIEAGIVAIERRSRADPSPVGA